MIPNWITWVLLLIVLGMMIMEYMELKRFEIICEEYNKRTDYPKEIPYVNISFPDD